MNPPGLDLAPNAYYPEALLIAQLRVSKRWLRANVPALPGQAFAPHPRKAWGEKYKRLLHVPSGLQVDLFVVTPPAEWGPIFAIRTGPAALSQRAVTWLHAKGMRCEEGRILRGDEVVPCPDEATFFRLAGMKYDPPEERW